MYKRNLMIGAAAMIAMAGPAQADSLRDALVSAYQTNPTLSGARAAQRAVDEGVPIAKADGLPNATSDFGFQENFLRNANSFTAPLRQSTAGGTFTVPIYSGGAVKNAVRAARTRVEAGQFDLRATEASIFSNVVATYMDVIRDTAIVNLNRANVGVLTVNLEASSDRFEIGDLTRTDVAQYGSRGIECCERCGIDGLSDPVGVDPDPDALELAVDSRDVIRDRLLRRRRIAPIGAGYRTEHHG